MTVPAPNNAHSGKCIYIFLKTCFTFPLIAILYVCTNHSSDTEYLPQRGRQARERRGRTGFATNTDQEEQNERPLSTKLRGVGGRGRGKGRKEVTVPANNAHSGIYIFLKTCFTSPYCMCVQTTAQILSTCLKEDAKPGKEEEGQDLQLIRRSRTRGPSPPSYEE